MRTEMMFESMLVTGANCILMLFAMYLVIAVVRPEAIVRRWAYNLGLVTFGIGVTLPTIATLLATMEQMTQTTFSATRGSSLRFTLLQVAFSLSFGFLAVSCIACIGSLLPKIVYVQPTSAGPPRNPFED